MVNPAWLEGGDISPTEKYAWSEDNGWVNFSPAHGGVTVHATCLNGYAWTENVGWISLGGGMGGRATPKKPISSRRPHFRLDFLLSLGRLFLGL